MSNAPAPAPAKSEFCNAAGGTYRCQKAAGHPADVQHACVAGVVIGQPKVRIFRWGGGQGEQWFVRSVIV